ncbi:MAG: SEL1-like repeat protein [Alphaproteobacteria bacterium]|nr:SEL1-like repeat protein [Alphaproteobacteria bacterium]
MGFDTPKAVFNPFLSLMQDQIWLKGPMAHPEQATAENGALRRNAARSAILEAARSVLARVGTTELSLSVVAIEAGFNASTVFGHFRNKDELLIAVLAEDLANIAATMRGGWAPADFENLQMLAVPDASQAELAIPEHEVPTPILAADSNVVRLYGGDASPMNEFYPTVAPIQSEQDQPSTSAEIDDGRYEVARLLADIDCRLKRLEDSAANSVSLSEHGMKALFDRMEAFERQQNDALEALNVRTDELVRRQGEAASEMHVAINHAASRIEVLESQRRADQDRPFGKKISDLPVQTPDAVPPSPPDLEELDDIEDTDSYRSAAERAASAAATLATIEIPVASTGKEVAQKRWILKGRHYFLAALAVAVVFVAAAIAAFHVGHARGRELATAGVSIRTHVKANGSASHHDGTHLEAAKRSARQDGEPQQRLASAAQQGSPVAELTFGLQLLRGEGTIPNKFEAAQWIRRAAEKRNPVAQYWLASLYEHGDGVAPDAAEAVRWYEAAAIQGNRKAMHALGIAYAQGMGTQKNYSEAARWFTGGAELGLVNSQFNLGVLYERGLGVPQNLLNAYKWYAIAAVQGDAESQARVAALKTQLKADDLAAGERAAQSFHARTPLAEANDTPEAARLP